ncbi:unnamed protein product [marine sediment metagenome]|uniref:Uncharacterized protein n=1 Tax=marine sediment metagenome TaxID=412755 RepID=X0Y9D5_9ZZZZ
MAANLYQRGEMWWARVKIAGKVHRFSTGQTEREKAERYVNVLVPLLHECNRLGLRFRVGREGLFQMAKRIEAAWIRIERLLSKMRDRGFLGT